MKTEIPLYDPITEITGQKPKVSNRAVLNLLCAWLLALTVPAAGQQPKKVPRIGYVSTTGQGYSFGTFRQGLRDLGYIEGKNIVIEYRSAGGKLERVPSVVAELVQLKIDVLVSPITAAILAAKQATTTIPVVMVTQQDPVATGLIDSFAHPGGNITGLTRLAVELSGKRLELFKEMVPRISRVGILLDADYPNVGSNFKEYEDAARVLKIPLQSLELSGPSPDLEAAFRDAAKGRVSALITIRAGLTGVYRKQIADLAIKNRLPSMYEGSDYVNMGGLVSYSANEAESYRRAAWYVDKILKGTKPADLPVERPTKFELVINLKTAKQIGVTISPNVLLRADRVIR